MSAQVGGQTVYITSSALLRPEPPKWHHPGRTAGHQWLTRCGLEIAQWPSGEGPPRWAMTPIRRLFAGVFAAACANCERSYFADWHAGRAT